MIFLAPNNGSYCYNHIFTLHALAIEMEKNRCTNWFYTFIFPRVVLMQSNDRDFEWLLNLGFMFLLYLPNHYGLHSLNLIKFQNSSNQGRKKNDSTVIKSRFFSLKKKKLDAFTTKAHRDQKWSAFDQNSSGQRKNP